MSHAPWYRIYIGQVKESHGRYPPLWITYVRDAKSGASKDVLYKQSTQGRPCSMSLTDKLIESTVPDELRGEGGFDLLMQLNVYIEFDEEWGKRKTA